LVNFLTQLYGDLKLAGYRYCLAHRHDISHPSRNVHRRLKPLTRFSSHGLSKWVSKLRRFL
jgi:hypothetical protein